MHALLLMLACCIGVRIAFAQIPPLAAGGRGNFIGDGRLNYNPEHVLELYYSLGAFPGLWFFGVAVVCWYSVGMKRFSWLLVAGLLATCSSKNNGEEGTTETEQPDCPATASEGAACTKEGRICEYSYALTCPMGCSGGDYHSYQCSKGRWVDYAHSAGAPQCYCRDLDFPKDMQGTWLFYQPGAPDQYVWIRFSALDNTLSDAGTPGQGTLEVLASPSVPTDKIPWSFRNGAGRWYITARPLAFELRPASTGASASVAETYTLTSRQGQIPFSLRGCLLHVTMDSDSGTQLEACKYPDDQCDAAMKSCLTL